MIKGNLGDTLFRYVTHLLALSVFVIIIGIIFVLFQASYLSISTFGPGVIVSFTWDPNTNQFGAAVPLLGTFITSLIATIIGVPLSFGIAVFLTQLCPHLFRHPFGIAVELLAGIPSIVYGIWGLFVFAPFFESSIAPWLNAYIGPIPYFGVLFRGPSMGIGVLPAGIILSIMIIPYISSVMRDAMAIVPRELEESAYALGATKWEFVWKIILPYTKVGLIGGIMLGLGRALGETMAVAFMIGNAHEFNASLLMPGSTISSVLANEFNEAVGELYTSTLVGLGLVLFLITGVVLAGAKLMLFRLAKQEGKH